ncbi:hypothetical protein [Butyrivibrio fibrisolvens]|uniref:hypothetical protein n=1 Tax=Butyrivibrio fibrisolvens TaxID=831 RepID=UPI0020BE6A0D|nr:hypothetical protein [Butyrivibrio fibrisolvens]
MPQKQQTNSDNLKRGLAFAYRVGDYFENSVSDMIANTHLGVAKLGDNEEPSINTWYRVDIPMGLTGDGSEYYIYIKKGSPKNLLIFLSGGELHGIPIQLQDPLQEELLLPEYPIFTGAI